MFLLAYVGTSGWHSHASGLSAAAAPGCACSVRARRRLLTLLVCETPGPSVAGIAITVAGIPDSLGGKRMAIRVAELARDGLTPDWMPGAVPRCMPTIVKENQHGTHAGTIVVGIERIRARGPGAWHMENSRNPGLPVYILPPPETDRGRPSRL